MMKLITAILMGLVFTGMPCQSQTAPLTALRDRIERYHKHFSQERYDLMWEMSSTALHKKNNNDKRAYVEQFRKYAFGRMRPEIIKIDLQADRAKARVKIVVWSKPDKKWVTEVDDETWVFEKGRWVFEDYRVAEGGVG